MRKLSSPSLPFLIEAYLFTDGSSIGNPGMGGAGVIIKIPDSKTKTRIFSKPLGVVTNNEAEYEALIYGLNLALELHLKRVSIHVDSELLYYQLMGEYRVKAPNLLPKFQLVIELLSRFEYFELHRERSIEADRLAKKAAFLQIKQ